MCITILSFDHPEGTSVDSMRCLDEHLAQGQSSGVGKRTVWRPFHGAAIGVVATGFGVGSPDILVNSGFWNGVPTGVISFPGGITYKYIYIYIIFIHIPGPSFEGVPN